MPHSSRRRFLQAGVGLGLTAASPHLWTPASIHAQTAPTGTPLALTAGGVDLDPSLFPTPIPAVDLNGEHIAAPDPGGEPSSFFNFDGMVGLGRFKGTGKDGNGKPLIFGGPGFDMRFFQGTYVAANGTVQQGTFIQA